MLCTNISDLIVAKVQCREYLCVEMKMNMGEMELG
jgi:hypothetical protein